MMIFKSHIFIQEFLIKTLNIKIPLTIIQLNDNIQQETLNIKIYQNL